MTTHADLFDEYRPLLFAIAYEITGTATDADDVLQESFIRWSEVDLASVESPRAYLAQVVSRQSLNSLRTAQRRREEYVGNWLPEPIRTERDAADDVVLAESVSMAMLLVLETLGPDERTVFVMHEVFGFGHAEIAETIGKSAAAVRQIAHRAREHVQARRRRYVADAEEAAAITASFLLAASTGAVDVLMEMLAPDAVSLSDGGGKLSAARRPIIGADHVARYLVGIATNFEPGLVPEFTVLNGLPAVLLSFGDRLDSAVMIEVVDSLVSRIYIVRNPEKLAAISAVRLLAR
ncbi:RNA polymerase sigma-70 factor [Antrihabitans stalactiti]|uniref:RNA polymerase sigma-70 factor n=1 Tax=Antrihabitans stalactiti TaxID=2584121 RepID=A0A848KJV4_9NOCA|nr:RNA polymerase sigma-70 factor [Antrihabitans stalactiti]